MLEAIIIGMVLIACSIIEKDVEKEDAKRAENNNILFGTIKKERED